MMNEVIEAMYQGRTLVFGHRGASAYAPMNTLPAFELAVEQGAHGVELDVWLSKDGYLVVIHDALVDGTTDGSGHVRAMTLAQLRELSAHAQFSETFRGVRIPTLHEVFEAVGNRLFINVEIKSETTTTNGVEQVVAKTIARFGLQHRVIVSSFNPLALRRFRRVMPEVPIGFLHDEATPYFLRHFLIGLPHEARHPHHTEINAQYMAWAKQRDYCVNAWTVNEPSRVLELHMLGVNGIITDKPDMALHALRD